MENLWSAVTSFVDAPAADRLPVLIVVGDELGPQRALAAEARARLGDARHVRSAPAPAEMLDPYAGFLAPFADEQGTFAAFVETLPPAAIEAPYAQVPRALAQSLVNLAGASVRLGQGPLVWVVAPADGMTPGGLRLLEQLADEPGPTPALRLVLALTLPGSAELLVEMRRRLAAADLRVLDAGEGEAVPPTGESLALLAPGARTVLELLSVTPGAVAIPLLLDAFGSVGGRARDGTGLVAVLRDLGPFLVPQTEPELGDERVRRALLQGLPRERVAFLHDALSGALERGRARPPLRAFHAARGTTPSDAVGSLIDAAQLLRELGERELAHEALRQAYLLLEPEQWYRRIEILERRAETLIEMGDFHGAVEAQEEITELAARFGDADRPDRLGAIADSYREIGRLDEAERALDRADELRPVGEERLATSLAVQRAEVLSARGDRARSRRILAGLGDRLPLRARHLLTRMARADGRMGEALREARALLEKARRAGDVTMAGHARNELGHVYYEQSLFREALSHYQEALACFEQLGDRSMVTGLLLNMGMTHYESGGLDEAETLLARALALKEREGDLRGLATALNNLGAVRAARGDFEGTLALVRRALAILCELKDEVGEGTLCANLAAIEAAMGDVVGARQPMARARAIATQQALPHLEALVIQTEGEMALAEGRWGDARALLGRARSHFGSVGARVQESVVLSTLAQASALEGAVDEALQAASEALAIATEVGHPGHVMRAKLALALASLERSPLRSEALARDAIASGMGANDADFGALAEHVLGRALDAQGSTGSGGSHRAAAARRVREAAEALPEGRARDGYLDHALRRYLLTG